MVHTLRLDNYSTTPRKLVLGTNSSFGTESIKIERGAGWDGLNLTATWHIPGREEPLRVALLDGDAMDVPPEVTKEAKDGVLVLAGLASGVQRASCNVEYLILEQAGVYGGADAEPTPELAAQVLEATMQAKANAEAAAQDASEAKANANKAQQAAENAAADAAKAGPYAEAALSAKEAAEAASDDAQAAARAAKASETAAADSASNAAADAAKAASAAKKAADESVAAAGSAAQAETLKTAAAQAAEIAQDAAESLQPEVSQLKEDLSKKQDTLVSGQNIKTLNGQSILGSGNIETSGAMSQNILDITLDQDVSAWIYTGTLHRFYIFVKFGEMPEKYGIVLDALTDSGYSAIARFNNANTNYSAAVNCASINGLYMIQFSSPSLDSTQIMPCYWYPTYGIFDPNNNLYSVTIKGLRLRYLYGVRDDKPVPSGTVIKMWGC